MNPLHNRPHSRLEDLNGERDDAFRSRLRAVLVESGHAGPLDADVLLHDVRQQISLLADKTLELESARKGAVALESERAQLKRLQAAMSNVAKLAMNAWDSDNTSKCGKLLFALCGRRGIVPDLDDARKVRA